MEVYGKTLGILGFGRIGQLVAERAKGFGMNVLAFDPYVSAPSAIATSASSAPRAPPRSTRAADIITIHLPKTPETANWLDAEAFAQMKDGVRVINCARGELLDDARSRRRCARARSAGAALDVFRDEPVTDHPLFGMPGVIVTPHLGASTAEAQDRAGYRWPSRSWPRSPAGS